MFDWEKKFYVSFITATLMNSMFGINATETYESEKDIYIIEQLKVNPIPSNCWGVKTNFPQITHPQERWFKDHNQTITRNFTYPFVYSPILKKYYLDTPVGDGKEFITSPSLQIEMFINQEESLYQESINNVFECLHTNKQKLGSYIMELTFSEPHAAKEKKILTQVTFIRK